MDRLGTAAPRGIDDAWYGEIAVAGWRCADAHCTIGRLHVQRVGIRIGVHRDGGDAQASRGADDAAGDLAAVGDQQGAEHRHIRNTPNRVGSIGAFSAADSARPSTRRVSIGSMTPSSHRRAVA